MSYFKDMTARFSSMNNRDKVVSKNVFFSITIKGLSIVVGFLTMPTYLRYFTNQDVLGVWLTILSMLSWIFTFDLGIGNGLRNHLAIAMAKNDRQGAKRIISSSYLVIGSLCAVLAIIFVICLPMANWNHVFNIPEAALPRTILTKVVGILFLGLLLQFFLALVNSVYLAMQKAALPNLLMLLTNMALLLFMYFSTPGTLGKNIIAIAWAYTITINIPLLCANLYIYNSSLKYCGPRWHFFDYKLAISLLRLGGAFFFLQIMALVIFNTNNFLISALVGPGAVVQYQIYFKLFGLVSMLFVLAIGPIWSAVTEAQARGDFTWVLRMQTRLCTLLLLALVFELVILALADRLIPLWMGKGFQQAKIGYVWVIAMADLVFILTNINSSIANGLGKLKLQMGFVGFGALVNIPLAILFCRIAPSAISIVLANIVSLLPYCFAELISTRNYLNARIRQGSVDA